MNKNVFLLIKAALISLGIAVILGIFNIKSIALVTIPMVFFLAALVLMIVCMIKTGKVKAEGAKKRRRKVLPMIYKKKLVKA